MIAVVVTAALHRVAEAHHYRRDGVRPPDGDRETGGICRGRHDVTEVGGATVAEGT